MQAWVEVHGCTLELWHDYQCNVMTLKRQGVDAGPRPHPRRPNQRLEPMAPRATAQPPLVRPCVSRRQLGTLYGIVYDTLWLGALFSTPACL